MVNTAAINPARDPKQCRGEGKRTLHYNIVDDDDDDDDDDASDDDDYYYDDQ